MESCFVCNTKNDLYICKGCYNTNTGIYCSIECQKFNWIDHKKICKKDDSIITEKYSNLVNKITTYFNKTVSNSEHHQPHKFNPTKLKDELIQLNFFTKVDASVTTVFDQLLLYSRNFLI